MVTFLCFLMTATFTTPLFAKPESDYKKAESTVQALLKDDKNLYTIESKAWKQRPGGVLVLTYKKNMDTAKDFRANLFLWERNAKGGTISAQTEIIPAIQFEKSWSYSDASFKLDLAPYKVSAEVMAIGVRFLRTVEFPAGENTTETLLLHRQMNDKFSLIHSIDTRVEDAQRGPDELWNFKSLVIVDQKQTESFYDLLSKETATKSRMMEQKEKPLTCLKTRRFRWQGTRYVSQDAGCDGTNWATEIKKKHSKSVKP